MEVYTESRPWGNFEKFHENRLCTVKLIYINAHSRLSLQYHNKRSEFWKVIRGTAMVELGNRKIVLTEGETLAIPRQARHRVGALDDECMILEISYGRFEENDIVRIEDDYNRTAMPAKTRAATA